MSGEGQGKEQRTFRTAGFVGRYQERGYGLSIEHRVCEETRERGLVFQVSQEGHPPVDFAVGQETLLREGVNLFDPSCWEDPKAGLQIAIHRMRAQKTSRERALALTNAEQALLWLRRAEELEGGGSRLLLEEERAGSQGCLPDGENPFREEA